MSSDSLYWGEGLFLRPQHFQILERQFHDKLVRSEHWATPFGYGLHKIQIDHDALSNWRVSLTACHLRLKDGTQLRFNEAAHLSPVEIPRDAFTRADSRVRVYVGVPELRNGFSNTSNTNETGKRYLRVEEEVEDENAAGNPQTVEFRKLNPQILIGDDSIRGYDSIPIMQLKLGVTAEAPPQIDADYAPPVLVTEAWTELQSFVRSVYDRLGAAAEQFATQMRDRGIAFTSGHKEDLERILHLHAINMALGSLAYLPFTPGVHPFLVYRELCKAVSSLAIFRKLRRIPELPTYDHDDPLPGFLQLAKLLEVEIEHREYERKPFHSEGLLMSVRMESEWVQPDWEFYVGIESEAASSQVSQMLSEKELGLKVGERDKVDLIYTRGRRSVKWSLVGQPPRAFPRVNWHYFQVVREGVWEDVERTLNLGIRFNETLVESQVEGDNQIEAKDRESGGLVTMKFWLFAIRRSADR